MTTTAINENKDMLVYFDEAKYKQVCEERRKECFVDKPLNTYEECWEDVTKWTAFDPNNSNHSYIIFQQFKNDFTKYPIEYQMKLKSDIAVIISFLG